MTLWFEEPGADQPGPKASAVVAALRRYRLPVSDEARMQFAIGEAFAREGIPYRREVTYHADRIDFVVGRVGIECKVAFSTTEVTRQLERYAMWPLLDELVLVTSRGKHIEVSNSLGGKPVTVHIVRGLF